MNYCCAAACSPVRPESVLLTVIHFLWCRSSIQNGFSPRQRIQTRSEAHRNHGVALPLDYRKSRGGLRHEILHGARAPRCMRAGEGLDSLICTHTPTHPTRFRETKTVEASTDTRQKATGTPNLVIGRVGAVFRCPRGHDATVQPKAEHASACCSKIGAPHSKSHTKSCFALCPSSFP